MKIEFIEQGLFKDQTRMELLNQEILKQLLNCKHHQKALKAAVELELDQWIEKGGHVDFFCTNQKQVTFMPMVSYNLEGDCVILCDDVTGSKSIHLDAIRDLFQLYFDRVTEETKQNFAVEKTFGKNDMLIIVVEKFDDEKPVLPKKPKSPSRSPKPTKCRK